MISKAALLTNKKAAHQWAALWWLYLNFVFAVQAFQNQLLT